MWARVVDIQNSSPSDLHQADTQNLYSRRGRDAGNWVTALRVQQQTWHIFGNRTYEVPAFKNSRVFPQGGQGNPVNKVTQLTIDSNCKTKDMSTPQFVVFGRGQIWSWENSQEPIVESLGPMANI